MEGDLAAVYGGPTRPRQITRDLNGRTTSPTRRSTKGQWTAEEDETLHTAVKQFKGKKLEENWKKRWIDILNNLDLLDTFQKIDIVTKGEW
ncbi:transcription factor MYB3R-1 [Tanacetum coccineum]